MAKKRKGHGGAFGNANKAAKQDDTKSAEAAPEVAAAAGSTAAASGTAAADAPEAAAVLACHGKAIPTPTAQSVTEKFCMKSSLGVPFLVVSESRQLVDGVPKPTPDEWKELESLCSAIVKQWSSRGAVILADFEGDMMGFEGELVSAAFQRTFAIDPKSLRPLPSPGICRDLGLLIDLGCKGSLALVKRVMESDGLSKLIWGADGDVTALRYSPAPRPLDIHSVSVVDAQLAFSTEKRRLGMAAMLEQLPPESIAGLPAKDVIDFNTAHARNRRALALPLSREVARYAVDDLHRLDAILRSKKPSGTNNGAYAQAHSHTMGFISRMLSSPAAVSADKLRQYAKMLKRDEGVRRLAIAVRVKRHLLAVRHIASVSHGEEFAELEGEVDKALAAESVSIPPDLGFAV